MEKQKTKAKKATKSEIEEENLFLKKQLAWYRSFFDNASDAVFMILPETWTVLDANDFAANLFGVSKDELIGAALPEFRRIFKLLSKSASPTILSELSIETPSKPELMIEVSARFVDFEGQKMIQAIARDVSEQRSLTDKLVQADKLVLLGQLSAGVAHEIRNPLAAVNLNLQILQRKIETSAAEFPYISTALQGCERIAKIVEVTLNFSRPTLPDIKHINVNSLIPSTLELVSSSLRKKAITVDLDLGQDMPTVSVDAKQMQQVLINLITNGADAIAAKGNIGIKTYVENAHRPDEHDYVVVKISDTGVGIPPEDLSKIFNPFFTRKAEGTGLGLPITQRILHQHGGIIDVESVVGKGTTFYVKLPTFRGEN